MDCDRNLLIGAALLAFSTILLLKKKIKEGNKRKRRIWSREWLKRRYEGKGTLCMLNNELLIEDEKAYKNFLRMPNNLFEILLKGIQTVISKQDTVMRQSVSARNRLEITLRFLATGESYRSLMYSTRIHESTISRFVPEVCRAIYDYLKDEFLRIPSSEEEWEGIANDFYHQWDFPHC